MGTMAVDAYVTCIDWPFNFARKVYYGLQGRRVSDARGALQTVLATATETKCGHRHKPRRQ